MPDFDYTVTKYPADSASVTIQEDLQALGANGWRLVSVVGVAGPTLRVLREAARSRRRLGRPATPPRGHSAGDYDLGSCRSSIIS
jgi:hypothetical protein